jgi:hypothetical protein
MMGYMAFDVAIQLAMLEADGLDLDADVAVMGTAKDIRRVRQLKGSTVLPVALQDHNAAILTHTRAAAIAG